jgi:hypothetical protein
MKWEFPCNNYSILSNQSRKKGRVGISLKYPLIILFSILLFPSKQSVKRRHAIWYFCSCLLQPTLGLALTMSSNFSILFPYYKNKESLNAKNFIFLQEHPPMTKQNKTKHLAFFSCSAVNLSLRSLKCDLSPNPCILFPFIAIPFK